MLHLPAFMGYFLAHLLFLDKLRDIPLYELDWQELRRESPVAFPYVLIALVQHNLSLIYDNVPSGVFKEYGLDSILGTATVPLAEPDTVPAHAPPRMRTPCSRHGAREIPNPLPSNQ
ncbi:hypothetical protein [Mycobacterium stomatepiae]|uniref:Uncharacterized protein n=1 Tax=Mycobacterium stomatepiae TaxID=470076 RepID=A0A7I7QGT5_9MYCO|nr:hypothetical protein [Mycobacterium stomatepiae]MCV7167073.1 hypothetical protein [Mycobacterium stomatepiae]BBY25458.1 hypothetical protein MSTO_56630 [Mycobacterium stomatepiae]